MRKKPKRMLAAAMGIAVALLVGEILWRLLRRDAETYSIYFRDRDRHAIGPGATPAAELQFRLGIQMAWPDPRLPQGVPTVPEVGEREEWFGMGYAMPRRDPLHNVTWRPDAQFFICYTGPRQDYFDPEGCVEYRFNRFGIRDRDDLTVGKPQRVRRVVCVGDSFTLGWGVRAEHNWPRLVENALAQRWPDQPLQVINCGGCGSAYADEYALALRHRFGRFEPDVVLVTLCLNDLVLTNGKLCHYVPAALPDDELPPDERRWWMVSRLLADAHRSALASTALALDPQRDWVAELLDLPADHLWYRNKRESPAMYWKGGAPQTALRDMRDWGRQNGARVAVVLWPFLQGLENGATYPFAALHAMVGEFCRGESIPYLDLLPTLRGHEPTSLWVSPADMHPNEHAQTLVSPTLAAFVADQLQLK
jgi:lysophospholipase L1-like esterase